MTGNPWGKFFWNDWENDPGLRLCSLAAQGLWMRLLCIAAKASPTGYVLVNGRAPALDDLALLIGRPVPEIAPLMEELARNGVFSRDGKGRIYSRRMVKDTKVSATARRNGRKGGNPSLCQKEEKPPPLNRGDKAGVKPHKPEARSQKEAVPDGTSAASAPAGAVVNGGSDLKARIFGGGLAWLAEHSGRPPDRLRSMVGRWCRDWGDGVVLEAMMAASKESPVEPVAWINERLAQSSPKRAMGIAQGQARERLLQELGGASDYEH